MRTVGNVLWHFPFFGFVLAIATWLWGALLTATVIAAPVGLGLMEFGKFQFAPFTHVMVSKDDLPIQQNKYWRIYSIISMVLYFPCGLFVFLFTLLRIPFCFLSIFGIPQGLVLCRSLGTILNPVNKKCVHWAVGAELERRKAQAAIEKELGASPPPAVAVAVLVDASSSPSAAMPVVSEVDAQPALPAQAPQLVAPQRQDDVGRRIATIGGGAAVSFAGLALLVRSCLSVAPSVPPTAAVAQDVMVPPTVPAALENPSHEATPRPAVEVGTPPRAMGGAVPQAGAGSAPAVRKLAAELAAEDADFVDANHGRGWGDRCYLHYKAGRLANAKAACLKGLQDNPGVWAHGALLYNLGLIAEKVGDLRDAHAQYAESLAVRPGNKTVEAALSRVDAAAARPAL